MRKTMLAIMMIFLTLTYISAAAEEGLFYIWDIPYGTSSEEARTKLSSVLSQEFEVETNDEGGKFIAGDIDLSTPTLVAGYQLSSIWCYFYKDNGFDTFTSPNVTVENDGVDGLTVIRLVWMFKTDETTPKDYGLNAFLGIVNQFHSQYGGNLFFYAYILSKENIYQCPANKSDGSIDLDIARDLLSRQDDSSSYSIQAINNNIHFSLNQSGNFIHISMMESYSIPKTNPKYMRDYWEVRYSPTPNPIGF